MSSAFASFRSLLLPLLAAACVASAGAPRLSAQTPGTIDPTFNGIAVEGGSIFTLYLEDYLGTPIFLVGGDRFTLNLLNAFDGSLVDPSYSPPFGNISRIIYTAVSEIVPGPEGTRSIIVGGLFGRSNFNILNQTNAQNVLRLYNDGSVDTSFNVGRGANGFVTSVTPLPNGDVVVAGAFDAFNGLVHEHMARVDNAGALVSSAVFDPNLTFDATVLSVATQTVGAGTVAEPQFVVAGQFTSVSGAKHSRLVRLNYNGTVDPTFNPSFDDRTTIVVTQADGRILVGGDFINVNGEDRRHIVRLNYDGSIDQTFVARVTIRPGEFIDPAAVYVIKLLDDGSMYLGGNFTRVNGVPRNFLARVDANGVLDTAFDPGQLIINAVQALVVREGQLYVGETYTKRVDGTGPLLPSLIRLYTEGSTLKFKTVRPKAVVTTGERGVLKLTRSSLAGTTGPLTVYLRLTSDAVLGRDYTLNSPTLRQVSANDNTLYSVTFPAGNTFTTKDARVLRVGVVPTGKLLTGEVGNRSVTLTVVDAPVGTTGYNSGESQTVTLSN